MAKSKTMSVNLSRSDWYFIESVLREFSLDVRKRHERFMLKNGKVCNDVIDLYVRLDRLSDCISGQVLVSCLHD